MPHVLNRLKEVKFDDVRTQLQMDAEAHAGQGIYLEHLWQNQDDPTEVFFLFRVDDLDHCKRLIERRHANIREHDPSVALPETTFLND